MRFPAFSARRKRAFLIHLALSVLVQAAVVALLLYKWFPPPFFLGQKAWIPLLLVVGVDAVIGPCLTFLVCSPGKRRGLLLLDLTVIVALQVAALGWGLFTIHGQRVSAVIVGDGVFHVIDAASAEALGFDRHPALTGDEPRYGVIDLPRDVDARQKIRSECLSTNCPVYELKDLLVPFGKNVREELEYTARDVGKFAKKFPVAGGQLNAFAAARGKRVDELLFYPVVSGARWMAVALDRDTLEVAGWLTDLDHSIDFH